MPRSNRIALGGVIYHVLNRGNGRARLFHKDADYAAFLRILMETKALIRVQVLGYCLMPNHWHLVLLPRGDTDLSRFMLRLTTTHVRRRYAYLRDRGGGHLYQGRFKHFPVEQDEHLLTLMRYVEANPLRAKLVKRAKEWEWSSFTGRSTGAPSGLLDELPLDLPADWARLVEQRWEVEQLRIVRNSVIRGRPFGTEQWVKKTAKQLGLAFTLQPLGRPRKSTKAKSANKK